MRNSYRHRMSRPAAYLLLPALAVALFLMSGVMGRGTTARAAGIQVTYPAGWNLAGGPDGSVFGSAGNAYSLGAGDTAYTASAGSAPIAGGKGYWMYFPSETKVTLNGAGTQSAQVTAPAGQYVMIGNPSGTQKATVSGADQVLSYDTAAGRYNATTSLDIGQGAWAYSAGGGTIVIAAGGPALTIPMDTPSSATAAPLAVTPTPSSPGSGPTAQLGAGATVNSCAATESFTFHTGGVATQTITITHALQVTVASPGVSYKFDADFGAFPGQVAQNLFGPQHAGDPYIPSLMRSGSQTPIPLPGSNILTLRADGLHVTSIVPLAQIFAGMNPGTSAGFVVGGETSTLSLHSCSVVLQAP